MESALDVGDVIHHNSEPFILVEVKSKQYLDLALMELKKSVLGKIDQSFSLRGDGVLK